MLSIIYFVHRWSQSWEKEDGWGRLMASLEFIHSIVNGSVTDNHWGVPYDFR